MNWVSVAFDKNVKDWKVFVDGLNNSLPVDAGISFNIGGEPLRHPDFCLFVSQIERAWKVRTTLFGPGYDCLRVNHNALWRCEEIIAVFKYNRDVGVYKWMQYVVRLWEMGYNIRVESPVPIKMKFVKRWSRKGMPDFKVGVAEPKEPLPMGFVRGDGRSCDGESSCVWSNGGYLPCSHCATGSMARGPVYAYGELDEPFRKEGKEGCKLRVCPLERDET